MGNADVLTLPPSGRLPRRPNWDAWSTGSGLGCQLSADTASPVACHSEAVTIQAATLQQRWTRWTTDRPVLLDAALLGGAAVLEVILELHDASMPWPPTLLAVRIPVIIAVIAFRRRWPLSMLVLAVAGCCSAVGGFGCAADRRVRPDQVPPAMVRPHPGHRGRDRGHRHRGH